MITDDIVGFLGLINSINNESASEKDKKIVEDSMGSGSLDKKIVLVQEVTRGNYRYLNHDKERSGSFRISLDSRRKSTFNKLELCHTDPKFSLRSSVELESTKSSRRRINLYESYCEIMQKKHRRRIVKTLAENSASDHGVSIEEKSTCNRNTSNPSKLETTATKSTKLTPIFDFIHIRKSGQVKMKRKVFDGEKKKLLVESTINNLKSIDQKINLGLFRKTREKKVCKTEGSLLREEFYENAKRTKLDGWLFEEDKECLGTENF